MDRPLYPEELQRVIARLGRLPGLGRRTAERLGIALMQWRAADVADFGRELLELREKVGFCPQCGNFSRIGELCAICQDGRRDGTVLCVVEQAPQIAVIEKTGCFHGLYHVLGGVLSPLDGIGPEDLQISLLQKRLEGSAVRELVLALSADVSGEATAQYLGQICARDGLLVSRLASGLPVGTNLAFADAATLSIAISSRRPL